VRRSICCSRTWPGTSTIFAWRRRRSKTSTSSWPARKLRWRPEVRRIVRSFNELRYLFLVQILEERGWIVGSFTITTLFPLLVVFGLGRGGGAPNSRVAG